MTLVSYRKERRVEALSSRHDCEICGSTIVEGEQVHVVLGREDDGDRYYWEPYHWYHAVCHDKREVKKAL